MGSTIANQLYLLLIFTITGIAIGIFFDIFRISRKSFKTSDFITCLEDIIFWIITGIFFLYILFRFNNGEIRSFVIIGILFGIIMYMLTISKYFIEINVKIIAFLKKVIIYPIKALIKVLKTILKPFKRLIIKPLSFVVINIRKSIKNIFEKGKTAIKIKSSSRKNIFQHIKLSKNAKKQ